MRRSPIWMTQKSLWTERISDSSPSPTISGNVRLKVKNKSLEKLLFRPSFVFVRSYLFGVAKWGVAVGGGGGYFLCFGIAKLLALLPIPWFDFRPGTLGGRFAKLQC
jgi:hypothetical protein